MKNFYKIDNISISKGIIYINIDGIDYQFQLSKVSETLSKANEDELNVLKRCAHEAVLARNKK